MDIFLDIETKSRVNLKKAGVYAYTLCPDFSILMMSWAIDDGPLSTTLGHDNIVLKFLELQATGATLIAHNVGFERVCFSRSLYLQWLDPAEWHDTMAIAAERGLPMSLEDASAVLGCAPKDSAGKALIKLFCVPRKDGGFNDATTHPAEWLDFIAYCEQDVSTMREIDKKMGRWPNEMERRTWIVDQRINDRGLRFDRELCHSAGAAVAFNKSWQREEMELLTGVQNPGSNPQMMRWIEEEGLPLIDCKAENLTALRDSGTLKFHQHRALELRGEYALTSYGKFDTATITASEGDRIRGAFNFFGAHTGRWSGRGVQVQNLPRLSFDNDADAQMARDDLVATGTADPQDLKRLVRGMFTGPLTVVDYAAIEARVIAWLAGERWALEAFIADRDIYVETQNRLGLKSRFEGKVAVLALGYQGSVGSLRALMGSGAYLAPDGSITQHKGSLRSALDAGLDPVIPDDVLLRMVRQWRRANPRIVQFWYDLQDAIPSGGAVGRFIKVRRRGAVMAIDLPSGRSIMYHGLRFDRKTESWSYANSRYGRSGTYGGRLAENVTQAVARDLLAEALVRLDSLDYPVVAHVHDEVVIDGAYDIDTIKAVMNVQPKWAAGLPIDSEGGVVLRYRKL